MAETYRIEKDALQAECLKCGALVTNVALHDRWHLETEKAYGHIEGKKMKPLLSMVTPWCLTHACQFLDKADKHCLWDRVVGPRPGRGECQMIQTRVFVEELEENDQEVIQLS